MACASVAQADLITTHFTGTYLGSTNSLYTEGFQFQFSLTYDNAKDGTDFNQYLDGSNEVGEFGDGDDILFRTYSLTPDGGREVFRFDSSGNVVGYLKETSFPYDFQTDDVALSTDLIPTYSGTAFDSSIASERALVGDSESNHPNLLFFQNKDDVNFGFEWFDDGFFTQTLPSGLNVYGWGSSSWVFMSESGELQVENLSFYITEVKVSSVPEPVTIDIKPGSDLNSINLSSGQKISVAILTTDTFLAFNEVDPLSVKFGPAEAREFHKASHVKDVDEDGDMDVLFHFDTQDTGIACGDIEATLTGMTFAGEPIIGTDTIETVNCP
jgi:hypothetical protein